MKQYQATFAILKRETLLVIVLLIGKGKILLATLPTLIDLIQVYIFITPFRALVNNIVKRFRANKLKAIKQ